MRVEQEHWEKPPTTPAPTRSTCCSVTTWCLTAAPWIAAQQDPPPSVISQSLLKFTLSTRKDFTTGGTVVKNSPANAEDTGSIPAQEYPTCHRATKCVCHNYWACALEPGSSSYWNLCVPCSHALQQETPLQWEARTQQLERRPCSLQRRPSTAPHLKNKTKLGEFEANASLNVTIATTKSKSNSTTDLTDSTFPTSSV